MARFVIADDSRPQRLWLREALTTAGHAVVGEADDGVTAVAACARLRPDFVVMDINMPSAKPGDVASREILAAGTARVIVLTLNAQESIVGPLREIGCLILKKPIHAKPRFLAAIAPVL